MWERMLYNACKDDAGFEAILFHQGLVEEKASLVRKRVKRVWIRRNIHSLSCINDRNEYRRW